MTIIVCCIAVWSVYVVALALARAAGMAERAAERMRGDAG